MIRPKARREYIERPPHQGLGLGEPVRILQERCQIVEVDGWASSTRFYNGRLLRSGRHPLIVMAALDAAIQEKLQRLQNVWMAGSSPAMTTLAFSFTASLPRLLRAAR